MSIEAELKEWITDAVREALVQALTREEQTVKLYGEYVSRAKAMKIIGCGRTTLSELLDSRQLTETEAGIRVRDIANLPQKKRRKRK